MPDGPGRNPLEELAELFVDRYRRGERPSISEYVARYPQWAAEIQEVFPALVLMEQAAEDLQQDLPEPAAQQPVAAPPLSQLGDFRIIREVGHGGMGVVYEAEQLSLRRRVALKVLPRQLVANDAQHRRFEREARAAARLHHTNIVPVFGFGQHDGLHYYVMQFIQGLSLDQVLAELRRIRSRTTLIANPAHETSLRSGEPGDTPVAAAWDVTRSLFTGQFAPPESADSHDSAGVDAAGKPPHNRPAPPASPDDTTVQILAPAGYGVSTFALPGETTAGAGSNRDSIYWHSVARIGSQIAAALHHAHEQGIVHRDVKPGNLLLDTYGVAWITDFGLAKSEDQQDLTRTGDVLGTLRYMAPEQFAGRSDARSDVYSLGLTLYEMLAMQPAFDESDRRKLVRLIATTAPPRLRALDPSVPRDLETIVHKAIEREQQDRYASAADLRDDLERFLVDEPIRARRSPIATRVTRWCRKNKTIAALSGSVASLLLALVVVLAMAQTRIGNERDRYRDALRRSLLAQARYHRQSGQVGQRVESLQNIAEAAAMSPGAELRDEAIRCLALHDLERVAEWTTAFPSHAPDAVAFDPALEVYVAYANDAIEIRRVPQARTAAGELVRSLPVPALAPRVARFSPDGRRLAVRFENPVGRDVLLVWDRESGERLLVLDDVPDRAFDFDQRGSRLAYAAKVQEDWVLHVRELSSENAHSAVPLAGRPFDIRWQPGGVLHACTIPDAHAVQVIDGQSGRPVHSIDYGEDIYAVAWSPTGDALAVGQGFHVALTLLARPEAPVLTLSGHRWMVHGIQFHPSGDFLVTHSLREGQTRLWDLRSRRELLSAPGHSVRFSATGDRLAICRASQLEVSRFHGEREYTALAAIDEAGTDCWRMILHPQRPLAVDCGRNGIRCWDLSTRRLVSQSEPDPTYTIHFDPASGDLLSAGESGVWRRRLNPPGTGANGVLQAAERITLADDKVQAPETAALAVSGTPDGETLVVAFRHQPCLYLKDVPTGRIEQLPCDLATAYVAVSADGRWIASGNYQVPGFFVRERGNPENVLRLPADGSAGQVFFSPDGRLLVACANDRYLVYHVGSWELAMEVLRSSVVDGAAAFSPDGRLLALSLGPREVELRNTRSGAVLARFDSDRDPINILNVAFSPQAPDRLCLSCGPSGARIWDLRAVRAALDDLRLNWLDEQPVFSRSARGG